MNVKVNGFYQPMTKADQPKKDGSGTFPIYNYFVITEMNGQSANINVRTFSDKSAEAIVTGADLELEAKTYQGFTYYQIVKPAYTGKGGYKGYSKPTYDIAEYDNLFRHAYKISTGIVDGLGDKVGKEYADVFTRLLSTYIISATNAGVKISVQQPINTAVLTQEPQPNQQAEKVANVMGGQVDNTPPDTTPMSENDIPF